MDSPDAYRRAVPRTNYRMPKGRQHEGPRALSTSVRVIFPLDLFQAVLDDSADSDVAMALSMAVGRAYLSDYVRAGCYLLHILLASETRGRVLQLLNLPDARLEEVVGHLAFHWAPKQPQTSEEAAQAIQVALRETPGEEPPEGEAPAADATPWDSI